jgi:hypothetical protein
MPRRIEPLGTQCLAEGVHVGAYRGWTWGRAAPPAQWGRTMQWRMEL